MKVDNGTTNFAVYEDATEFYGMAEVTLPEITQITEEVKGAGISGAFNGAFVGHIEAMTLTLNFRSVTADAVKLAEPRNHQLDLRAAQQYWDNTAGKFVQQAVKHVLMVTPTKFAPGKLAPAASAEASGEYAATYFATYIDGKKVLEIDIINFIYYVNGTDYTQEGGALSDEVISENVAAAVQKFKTWQAERMGRDVNPSYLIQLLMEAGVKRVEVRSPAFTTVADNAVAQIGETSIVNGGAESE